MPPLARVRRLPSRRLRACLTAFASRSPTGARPCPHRSRPSASSSSSASAPAPSSSRRALARLRAIAWPPTVWAANSPQWLDQFKGTRVVDAQEVAQKNPHDYLIVPEGIDMWNLANAPLNSALKGEIATRDAMKKSADDVNALFARRPPEWK